MSARTTPLRRNPNDWQSFAFTVGATLTSTVLAILVIEYLRSKTPLLPAAAPPRLAPGPAGV